LAEAKLQMIVLGELNFYQEISALQNQIASSRLCSLLFFAAKAVYGSSKFKVQSSKFFRFVIPTIYVCRIKLRPRAFAAFNTFPIELVPVG